MAGRRRGRWLQTRVTRDTGPQCPSVNSLYVSTCLSVCACMCVVQYCIVQPLGSCGWCPLYVALLSHPFTSHCFACHTHTNAHTHPAPGLPYPLKARKPRCGSRLMLYGPGARREAHTRWRFELCYTSHHRKHLTQFLTPANSGR